MMTFNEKIQSDIECLNRVIALLKANNAEEKAIEIVKGIRDAAEVFKEKDDE